MSSTIRVRPSTQLRGTVTVPGDKSISHRSLMLGALADGVSQVRGFLPAGDTLATLDCMRKLGVQIDQHDDTTLTVHGRGMNGLVPPTETLNCVNAGTGMRLLAGILAGQHFPAVLDGSEQLRKRPMGRITNPLRQMGANVEEDEGRAPLHFGGAHLKGIEYEMPVASAQVKSCLLLAGLFAEGETVIIEPGPARDHTERMLKAMGAEIDIKANTISLRKTAKLNPLDLTIPADISSATFVLLAGLLCPDSDLNITHVGINPTRDGILEAIVKMGVTVGISDTTEVSGEPVATLTAETAKLQGTTINGDLVVRMIDEFPALMVAATQADGKFTVTEARELRVKETDRIAVMARELRKMGAEIDEYEDGFALTGKQQLVGATVQGHDDHRVAMSMVLAGLVAEGETIVEDAHCVNDSFPGFVETLQTLGANVEWV